MKFNSKVIKLYKRLFGNKLSKKYHTIKIDSLAIDKQFDIITAFIRGNRNFVKLEDIKQKFSMHKGAINCTPTSTRSYRGIKLLMVKLSEIPIIGRFIIKIITQIKPKIKNSKIAMKLINKLR